jgi:D-3-phosphoglycerate dehydrogenase
VADGEAAPILEAAHVYQVGASRDELPVRFHVDTKLIARMPNLLIASSNGAGYDPINVADCTKAGIAVLNQAGGNARSVAEHVVGMMIVLSKRIVEADRALRRGGVEDRNALIGSELLGKTIGIVGLGHAGGQVARICGALGLHVIACDPYLDADTVTARGARKVDFDTLLRSSDFVSVNCPLNGETRSMFGAREFGLMQRHAIFITAARGFIHDENELAAALRSKVIAGAGLDVWAQEPPPSEHPLMNFDTVIVSPHTAGVTVEARRNMGRIAAEQILAALDGRCPPRLVNPDCWPHYSTRFERIFGFRPDALWS